VFLDYLDCLPHQKYLKKRKSNIIENYTGAFRSHSLLRFEERSEKKNLNF